MALSTSEQMRWRLLVDSDTDRDTVAFVLPYFSEGKTGELLLETNVVTPHYSQPRAEMHWSHDDLDLFLSMLSGLGKPTKNDIVLNFSDPAVITLIQVVASARFAVETDLTAVIMDPSPILTTMSVAIGNLVAIHSTKGATLAVLAQITPETAKCVMLEPFVHPNIHRSLQQHEVVSVPKTAVMPVEWELFVGAPESRVH